MMHLFSATVYWWRIDW